MNTTECPMCGAPVTFAPDTVQGEILPCKDCGCELEVITLEPPKVEEAPEAGEDWGQ